MSEDFARPLAPGQRGFGVALTGGDGIHRLLLPALTFDEALARTLAGADTYVVSATEQEWWPMAVTETFPDRVANSARPRRVSRDEEVFETCEDDEEGADGQG